MVMFRCKRSGNTVSFTNEDDIAGLRKHEGYEEVVAEPATEPVKQTIPAFLQPSEDKPVKRRGRQKLDILNEGGR